MVIFFISVMILRCLLPVETAYSKTRDPSHENMITERSKSDSFAFLDKQIPFKNQDILEVSRRLEDTFFFQQIGQDINGVNTLDRLGWSVSLSANGSIVAMGAYLSDQGDVNTGLVQVYQFNDTHWNQLGQNIGGSFNDYVGRSVSLSSDGSVVAVGGDNGVGRVRIYRFQGSLWNQIGSDIIGEAADDQNGFSVGLSANGSVVAIGAISNDDGGLNAGSARIFRYNDTHWNQIGQDINGVAAEDRLGYAVSISADGTIVAVGAPYNDGAGTSAGFVQIFQFNETYWNLLGQTIEGTVGDEFGYSVSLSSNGTIVAIGGLMDNFGGREGKTRVYQYNSSMWNQIGQVILGEATSDRSGSSVAVTADGQMVAIGAVRNDGDIGFGTGHVRVFQFNGLLWEQIGQDINGKEGNNRLGTSVAISADGTIVASGARGTNEDRGRVRVFQLVFAPTAVPTSSPTTSPTGSPTTSPTSSPTFTPIWSPLLSSHLADSPMGFAKVDGNRYQTGFTRSFANGTYNENDFDAFVMKRNSSLDRVWKVHMGGPGNDVGLAVTADSQGNVYVTGKTEGSLKGFTNLGGSDVFLSKLSSEGVEQWTVQFGSIENDWGRKVVVSEDEMSVWVSGTYLNGVFEARYTADGELI